ncbi:RdgB/HAM1 family non-canonical purine NTP pyrophosphatase [uncultured Algimonas sp.]|uniref:RdgB/HAM1 family non-canonical purine NTP pyrophosphatase n=1 Tax=uncultured Algimonas sp. TaxID=1547920 RepID=UPI00263311CE|nr:RdgB/HAM1 family non-canonical purine NTP pyrophosphatase [uncultured Algimonas sp.]
MTAPTLRPGQTLVVASHNEGKVREIRALLAPFGLDVVSAGELGLPEPEETEDSYAGNARLKAVAAATASGHPALSDDSGIDVTSLGGRPGIHAARWAEDENGERDFGRAMTRVQEELGDSEDRSARFVCALCLAFPDGSSTVYEGKCEGRIVWPPRGERGFGYDPIFVMDGDTQTFAEIDPAEKHAKSHRAAAFARFLADQFPDSRNADAPRT